MLVKIIAIGLDPAAWKLVFRRLREEVPDHPFSVGIFSTDAELDFLEEEFFPFQWRREAPDFLLCDLGEAEPAAGRLAFLRKVWALPGDEPPAGTLVVDGLERTLRGMLRQGAPLGIFLDNDSRFQVSDPAFLLRAFPKNFPRIRVDAHLSGLRLVEPRRPRGAGAPRELLPERLAESTLVGFSEIETLIGPEGAAKPKDWLRALAAAEGLKRLPRTAGLIREKNGMFLFPGLPLERIRGIELEGVPFAHLIDRKALVHTSPQFLAFRKALEAKGAAHALRWSEATARIRQAEARTDIPIVCGGDNALLRESLAALLARSGYPRCYTLAAPGEGVFQEASLLLQVAPWAKGELGAQADAPRVMELSEDLAKRMAPLERLLPWRELPFQPPPPDLPTLSAEAFSQQRKRLAARGRRVNNRLELEEKKHLLLEQESAVLQGARERLAELLEAGDTIRVWDGSLPGSVRQALVFSHDQEEAGAVLQALSHIQKKRWFDLSPFTGPDTMRNLSLDGVRHYGEDGIMLITGASRERLEKQQARTVEESQRARTALGESEEALTRLGSEAQEVQEARERLARQFIWEALSAWLAENTARLDHALDTLREKHEQRWFNRARVRRALIVPYVRENGEALLDACAQVYPGFSRDLSVVVPYEFDVPDALPEEDEQAVRREAESERLAPGALAGRLSRALERHNEARFAEYLQVVSSELTGMRMDLVLVEHRPRFAGRILDHLRRALPPLENTAAVLVLSELWEPPAQKPLPWPRTRVVLLPRMGALNAEDCAGQIRSLYAI